MTGRIHQLLKNGESEYLDYKQSITDAGKIAKTIVAFANGKGGTLLIGVKDNRRISGVRSEDEKYMFDLAVNFYCKPKIEIKVIEHEIDDKTVLECVVYTGEKPPYLAKNDENKWITYLRVNDQTLKAGAIAVQVMKRKTTGVPTIIKFQDEEKLLLEYLATKNEITLKEYQKMISSNRWKTSKILINLVSAGIVRYNLTEKYEYFTLK